MGVADDLREAGTLETSGERIGALAAHVDRRVRVLCARHRALPAAQIAELAADPEAVVRWSVAWAHPLDEEACARLLSDPDRRVRHAVVRRQALSPAVVRSVIESGAGGTLLLDKFKTLLRDPNVTAELISDARWMHFAAAGSFSDATIRALCEDPARTFLLRRVAEVGTMSRRSLRRLARHSSRIVQEAVLRREDLSTGTARLIALTGGRWAAAAVLHRQPADRLSRLLTLRRCHRVLRRARAETSQNRLALRYLALSATWDVRVAVATNPRTGPRTLRSLAASSNWSVGEAVARRTDLPDAVIGALPSHRAVKLQLAANPATPEESVWDLLGSDDRFVHEMALTHPRAPLADVRRAARSGDTPAWVLRRLATGEHLPLEEREELLVWLTLGGGRGHPMFDPITCTGTPGESGEAFDAAYRVYTKSHGLESSLWLSRALVGRGAQRLDRRLIGAMARDSHPDVRLTAAGFNSIGTLGELRYDCIPAVSMRADTTYRALPAKARRPKVRTTIKSPVWAVAAMVAVVASIGAFHDNSASNATNPFAQAGFTTLPSFVGRDVPSAAWRANVSRPTDQPLCTWDQGSIWIHHSAGFIDVLDVVVSADQTDLHVMASDSLETNAGSTSRYEALIGRGEVDSFHFESFDGYGQVVVWMDMAKAGITPTVHVPVDWSGSAADAYVDGVECT